MIVAEHTPKAPTNQGFDTLRVDGVRDTAVVPPGFGQSEEGNSVAGFLLALYGAPDDADAFDTYYEATHAPLAAAIPGLRSFNISDGPVTAPDGALVFHRVAVLTFDDLDAIKSGLATPEGQATAADLAKFATGGVTLAMFEGKPVTTE